MRVPNARSVLLHRFGRGCARVRSLVGLLPILQFSVGLGLLPLRAAEPRDPWLWPFAAESIWNMPIGTGAVYKPAELGPARHVGVDTQFLLRTQGTDPDRPVLESPAFKNRIGTAPLGFSLRVPDDWIVPDIGPDNPYGRTPNANYAILLPDGVSVMQGARITRPVRGGPVYLPTYMNRPANRQPISIRGDGLGRIGQGASKMSTLGGTLRLGELVGAAPIRHAIKLNPWAARYCYYSRELPGWRWPALAADAYAEQEYKGRNPAVVMGSLLALRPEATPEALGLQTAPGRKLFHVLQDYGAYFTEDAHWDTWDLVVERDAELEFARVHGFTMKSAVWRDEINRLVVALHVIDNNGPERIGGGGVPRRPLAPPLAAPPRPGAER